MELDEFIDHLSDRPLTEQEKALMDEMRAMVADNPFKVILTGRRPSSPVDAYFILPRGKSRLSTGILMDGDFSKLEERVMAHVIKGRDIDRQLEKTILFGTRYTHCWFDEFEGIQTKDIPIREVFNFNREVPADHPERKREPKGPRGKWGKLK